MSDPREWPDPAPAPAAPLSASPVADAPAADGVALVPAVIAGSRDALEAVYRAHAATCFTLAFRLLGRRADAEDVLQDVFLALPTALRTYEERGAFAAWLRRVTARTALAHARHRRRTADVSAAQVLAKQVLAEHRPADQRAAAPRSAHAHPEGRLALRLDLETAIAALPDPLRAVFVLRAVEGFAHDEIAALLGITPANAMQRYSRACRQLRPFFR